MTQVGLQVWVGLRLTQDEDRKGQQGSQGGGQGQQGGHTGGSQDKGRQAGDKEGQAK